MRNKGALLLLLIAASSLIYAAAQQRGTMALAHPAGREGPRVAQGVSNGGELAWLGEAPVGVSRQDMAQRIDRVLTKMMFDLPTGQDTTRFVCKLPAEVGPVPMLEAVDAWLRAPPAGRSDPALLQGLYRAASRGNWLARVQVYRLLSARQRADPATTHRTVQLMEWMQAQRIGALYGAIGDALTTSHHDDDGPAITGLDIYAAMHHDYPSQYKVGRELVKRGDARQAADGRRMLDCVGRALPAYGQLFGSELAAQR